MLRRSDRHRLHRGGLRHHHHLLQPDGNVKGCEAVGRADGGRRWRRQWSDEGGQDTSRGRVWPAEGCGAGFWRGELRNPEIKTPGLVKTLSFFLIFFFTVHFSVGSAVFLAVACETILPSSPLPLFIYWISDMLKEADTLPSLHFEVEIRQIKPEGHNGEVLVFGQKCEKIAN